ncbi:GNAT family N-acetyltransferase [Alicyclobacillus dauci]|uniref:GNAT family N-acetyltransferase n=1 Tax=Alicyclobacillus dauci TaxID=1475485 RepID=A0ABY6YZJ1_9BACL|nr:GNAT family N-acetyltransferase [Alicyclobacillus dauci]WAH36001.1 GNAT family N-acetyltransferase [Alicyclobacillus dauci]
MNVEIIHVTKNADLDECIAIRREVFVDEQGVSEEEEIDEQDVVGVGHHLYVRDDAGVPVATARYKRYDDETAKIQRVAVRKPYRAGGYGRVVMEAIEQMAKSDGFRAAVLDAQCHAEGFYKKLGYTTISENPFLDAGILHVRMKKPLTSSSGE